MNLVFAGAPKSGKTSALAALYYIMKHEATATIKLAEYPKDAEYLDHIRQKWEDAETIGRTSQDAPKRIKIKADVKGRVVSLDVPDVNGEVFLQMLEDDSIDQAIASDLKDLDHLIYFVHAVSMRPAKFLYERPDDTPATQTETRAAATPAPLNVRELSTDPETVEIIRRLLLLTKAPEKAQITLVISAFDRAQPGQRAEDWLKHHLPLTTQFLESNYAGRHRVLGLSAQGGDYDNPEIRRQLLEKDNFCERPWLVVAGASTHDVSQLLVETGQP